MIVFTIIGFLVLLVLLGLVVLAAIGKFARQDRNQQKFAGEVFDEIDKINEVFEHAITDIAVLQTEVGNFKIQIGATQETLVDQVANVTSQVTGLIETTAGLHDMIEKGYEDKPVTAALPVVASPVHNNKGGRPRKGQEKKVEAQA